MTMKTTTRVTSQFTQVTIETASDTRIVRRRYNDGTVTTTTLYRCCGDVWVTVPERD